jgi:hypothetical protein
MLELLAHNMVETTRIDTHKYTNCIPIYDTQMLQIYRYLSPYMCAAAAGRLRGCEKRGGFERRQHPTFLVRGTMWGLGQFFDVFMGFLTVLRGC